VTQGRTPLGLVRSVFPDADDAEAHYLLWNRTGWPCFWRTKRPRREIVQSLRAYKRLLDAGKPPCEFCTRIARVPREGPSLCRQCAKAIRGEPQS
jgi:hypothetical protein